MTGRRCLIGLFVAAPAAAQPVAQLPSVTLGRGVTAIPPGVWRVTFSPERDVLEAEQRAALGRLAAVLQSATVGRVTLMAETSEGNDVSIHRRLTLARALAVKAALVAGGLNETRIDIRALGRTPNGRDGVDVLAPTAPRS